MDYVTAFIHSVSLIAAGLKEKEDIKEKNKYPFSKKFLHGMNMFFAVYAECSNTSAREILQNAHEEAFISNYAFKPIREWIADFKDDIKKELEEKAGSQFHLERLCYDLGEYEFHITEDCSDYLNAIGNIDITAEHEEKRTFDLLKYLKQEEYVAVRKFIIENPLADEEMLRRFKILYSAKNAVDCINFAYEDIVDEYYICPHCRWTMDRRYICVSKKCIDKDFEKAKLMLNTGRTGYKRLKRGVMRYIALPGRIEMKVLELCNRKGLKTELWPQRDKFDLEIVFEGGRIWEIDAKDYSSPYNLREKIIKDGDFPEGDYEKGFYIIDDYLKEKKRDYCDIVNDCIKNERVKCVTFNEFKSILDKELKNARII